MQLPSEGDGSDVLIKLKDLLSLKASSRTSVSAHGILELPTLLSNVDNARELGKNLQETAIVQAALKCVVNITKKTDHGMLIPPIGMLRLLDWSHDISTKQVDHADYGALSENVMEVLGYVKTILETSAGVENISVGSISVDLIRAVEFMVIAPPFGSPGGQAPSRMAELKKWFTNTLGASRTMKTMFVEHLMRLKPAVVMASATKVFPINRCTVHALCDDGRCLGAFEPELAAHTRQEPITQNIEY